MKQLIFLLTLTFISWTVTAQTKLDDAKKLITNDNFNGAKKLLEEYIAEGKDLTKLPEAYYLLGDVNYRNLIESNPAAARDAAREQFEKGLTLFKNNPYSLVGMGKLLLDAKNSKEAAKTFDQAIRSSRDRKFKEGNPDIYGLIGDAFLYSTQKDADQAVANYTRARDIDPAPASTWLRLGDGNLAKGDAGAAMTAYSTAAQKDKTNAEVYEKMAIIWRRARKLDLAIDTAVVGTKVNSQYAPLYKLLAEMYQENRQYNKVAPTLDSYLKLVGDQDPEARLRFLKYVSYNVKDYDRVIKDGEEFAAKFGDKYPSVYRWLAWSYVEQAAHFERENTKAGAVVDTMKIPIIKGLYTNANAASEKLMKAYASTPTNIQDYDYEYRARSAAKIGKLDEAVSMYKEVLKQDTTKTCNVLSGLVNMYYEAKDFKNGLDMLDEKISKCEVKNLEIFYAMYYAYYSKQYDRGIKYGDKYIGLKPTTTDGYYYKALCEEQLDDSIAPTFKAKGSYEKVISTFEAITDAGELARVKSQAIRAYNYLASAAGSASDFVKSKEYCQKVLVVDSTNATALNIMQQIQASGH